MRVGIFDIVQKRKRSEDTHLALNGVSITQAVLGAKGKGRSSKLRGCRFPWRMRQGKETQRMEKG